MPDRPGVVLEAAKVLARWSPAWAAAMSISLLAGAGLWPSVVGIGLFKTAFAVNAFLAGTGSAFGGLLRSGTIVGGIAAAFGTGFFGVLIYAGMVCAVLAVVFNPAFFAVTLVAWWAVLLAWRISQ